MKNKTAKFPVVHLALLKKSGFLVKTFSGNYYKISGDHGYLEQEFIIGGRKNKIYRTQMKLTDLYSNIRSVQDESGIVIAKRLNKSSLLISTNRGVLKKKRGSSITEIKIMSDRLMKKK